MTDIDQDLAKQLADMGVNIQPIEVDPDLLANDGVTLPNDDPIGPEVMAGGTYSVSEDGDFPMVTSIIDDKGQLIPISTPPGAGPESQLSVDANGFVTGIRVRDVPDTEVSASAIFNFPDSISSDRSLGGNPKDALGDAKVDPSLVPPSAKLYLAAGFADGAAKYGPYNWRENAVRARVYIAAAMRHLDQYLDGENRDPLSKVPHLGHAMACLAILADATETGNLIDDRPLPGAASDLIRRYDAAEKFGVTSG